MKFACAMAAGLLAATLLATPAFADGDFSGTHDQVTLGSKVCFADHVHTGVRSAATIKVATKTAINAWIYSAKFEYGKKWASWNLAGGKFVNCTGGPGNYTCDVRATACRAK